MPETSGVIYWDSSAVLSALFKDRNSRRAKALAERGGLHLLSTLAYAEVNAVIARMRRENILTEVLVQSAHEILDRGPWRRISMSPEWSMMRRLGAKHPLRGADLWHLASAISLKSEFRELSLLTFDPQLKRAAELESLA
jgi:predicted nucleic acid-binding protein